MFKKEFNYLYLPVEVKSRELVSRLYLASRFLREGIPVVVGKYTPGSVLKSIFEGRPVAIWKGLNANDALKLRSDAGVTHVYILDEEGFLVGDLKGYSERRFNDDIVRNTIKIFSWGDSQNNELRSCFRESEHKFLVSSNPRVDLWKAHGFEIYKRSIANNQAEFGDFVLIASNLGSYTNSDYVKKSLMSSVKNGPGSIEQYELLRDKCETMFHAFISLSQTIVEKTSLKVVIRPHPIDDANVWANAVKDIRGVHVVSRGDAAEWILSSRTIVHNCCTTSAEAYFGGVPVVSYCPDGLSLYNDDEINTLGVICRDEPGVIDFLANLSEYKAPPSLFIDNLVSHNIDSVKFIYDSIFEDFNFVDGFKIKNAASLMESVFDDATRFARRFKTSVTFDGVERQYRRTLERKFPVTSVDQISAILDGFNFNKKFALKIRPVMKNLFAIEPQ